MPTRKKRRKADGGLVPAILQYLSTQQDVYAERRNSGSLKVGDRYINLGTAGTLDISGYLRLQGYSATPFEIEAKTTTGQLRPSQKKRIALLEKMNAPYCVARSLSDVIQFLNRLRRVATEPEDARLMRRLGA